MYFFYPWVFLSISIYCLIAKETSGPPVAPSGKLSPGALPQTQSAANKQVCVHLGGPTVCVCVFIQKLCHAKFSFNGHNNKNVCIFSLSFVWSGQSQQRPPGSLITLTEPLNHLPGPWFKSHWGRMQACEEDLLCWWQRCNCYFFGYAVLMYAVRMLRLFNRKSGKMSKSHTGLHQINSSLPLKRATENESIYFVASSMCLFIPHTADIVRTI